MIWFVNIVIKGTIYWPYEQNFRTVSTGSRTGQEGQGKFLAQATYLQRVFNSHGHLPKFSAPTLKICAKLAWEKRGKYFAALVNNRQAESWQGLENMPKCQMSGGRIRRGDQVKEAEGNMSCRARLEACGPAFKMHPF